MNVTERVTAHDYEIRHPKRESSLVPGLMLDGGTSYRCPRCKKNVGALPHGDPVPCGCGLTLTRSGNSIRIEGSPTYVDMRESIPT